jgi:hypothetical protein
MRNVIYQYWDGPVPDGVRAGVKLMREYATRIGADHIFEENPRWQTNLGVTSHYFGAFKPIFDGQYDEYDNILFADVDVIPTEDLSENIFEPFYGTDFDMGIVEEWHQPDMRSKYNVGGITTANDDRWAKIVKFAYGVDVPRDKLGRVKVYNTGVVVYTKSGRLNAQKKLGSFGGYIKNVKGLPVFYLNDQPYLHAMMQNLNVSFMDYKWNSSVGYQPQTKDPRPVYDMREANNTNFVHVQLRGKSDFSEDKLKRIANLPTTNWQLDKN